MSGFETLTSTSLKIGVRRSPGFRVDLIAEPDVPIVNVSSPVLMPNAVTLIDDITLASDKTFVI